MNLWPPPPLQIVYLQGYILGSLRSQLKADCLSRAVPHTYPLPCPLQVLSRITHGCLVPCSCVVTCLAINEALRQHSVEINVEGGPVVTVCVCLQGGRKSTDVKLVQGLWWSGLVGGYRFSLSSLRWTEGSDAEQEAQRRWRKKTRKKLKVGAMLNNALYLKFLPCNETGFFVLSLYCVNNSTHHTCPSLKLVNSLT